VRLLHRYLQSAGRRAARRAAGELEWLAGNGGALVFLTGDWLSVAGNLAAHAVRDAGGAVCFYPLNWRDVFKGARLSLPATRLLFADGHMAETAFRNNPWLRGTPSSVVGAVQFDAHLRKEWIEPRETFCRQVGLDPARKIVCYSAASRRAYEGEAGILMQILNEMRREEQGENVQFLVRLNPAGSDPAFSALEREHGDTVRLLEPVWELVRPPGDREPVWRSGTERDARLLANVIRHSAAHVCLPSTRVVDFAMGGRPSVCVGFDPPCAARRSSAAQFADQEIFHDLFRRRAAWKADSPQELVRLLNRLSESPGLWTDGVRQIVEQFSGGTAPGRVHERIAGELAGLADGPGGGAAPRAATERDGTAADSGSL
jgi:hypothetical protein